MITLKLTEQKARELYRSGDTNWKQVLLESCGEKFFSEKISDRVKTFEDACAVNGTTPEEVIPFKNPVTKEQRALNGCAKVMQITKALNEEWEPDFSNSNQRKYYPWFEFKSGVGFSNDDDGSWITGTNVGSRLCYKSEELAQYAARQFQKEYNEFLNP